MDGVEIDAELSEIGRKYFDMNNPRLHLYHEDARPFLRRIDARYDVISVDAYRQPYIPFYLTTVEFFETVRDRLAPGGVLIVNVGHPEGAGRPREGAHGHDRRGAPARDALTRSRTPTRCSWRARRRSRRTACARPSPTFRRAPAHRARGRPAASAAPLEGGEVYTDDRAPVEWLIDKSIVDYASGE